MINILAFLGLTILACVVYRLGILPRGHYVSAFYTVVMLDTLCVWLVFPFLPEIHSSVTFAQALLISFLSAVLIGGILLEGGGNFVIQCMVKYGVKEEVGLVLVKNSYATLAPLLNALALIFWTFLFPSLGFHILWPGALIAGVILDFLDRGVVVPWFFKLGDALKIS
ncbi:MAG: hypothetical protein G01um101429_330 [Parcubacteria group bacterium Gr01-1014_29]|nr:MAG: hypothetical protein G01um101429_330 [Parcubacteria group bacterium Gr01-1014_29]